MAKRLQKHHNQASSIGRLGRRHTRAPLVAILSALAGNHMWRSPEAHAQGSIYTPSDILPFAIVVNPETEHCSEYDYC